MQMKCTIFIACFCFAVTAIATPMYSHQSADQEANENYHGTHVTFNPLQMHPSQEGTQSSSRHVRKPTGIRPPGMSVLTAGDSSHLRESSTTPHSATFSDSTVGRRSILTTPGMTQRNAHPERFEGQFIEPRFHNGLLRDLTIAATDFQGTLTFLLIAFLGSSKSATVNEAAWAYATGLLAAITMHSSSQCNPGITLSMTALGKLTPRQAAMNIGAQVTGAIAASGIQTLMTGDTRAVAQLTVSPARGLLIETVLTTILYTTVLWTSALSAVQKRTMPFLIALIFLGLEISGIPATSACLNPARYFGPAVVSGQWHTHDWIWATGPAIAVPLSLLIFKSNQLLQSPDAEPSEVGPGQLVDTYQLQRRRHRGSMTEQETQV